MYFLNSMLSVLHVEIAADIYTVYRTSTQQTNQSLPEIRMIRTAEKRDKNNQTTSSSAAKTSSDNKPTT